MNKQSNFLNERKRLLYNDGSFCQHGDRIMYMGKPGRVVNRDYLTLALHFDDGSATDFAEPEFVQKMSVNLVEDLVKNSHWVNKNK
jgi:hypothetical protein